MKKIAVTGCAGFLGSHLTKQLLSAGHQVIGLDNLSSGLIQNIEEVLGHQNFIFIEHDITRPETLGLKVLEGVKEIYHLASPASPRFYKAAPLETIAVNTIGTKQMLDLAIQNEARMVFTSTSEIYGDPEVHPQHEEYWGHVNLWGPRACYDEAKRLGEVYCYEYWQKFGLNIRVARLFNTYSAGLRNDDGRVISNFVTQALAGNNLTIYGDGTQSRSFCYIIDTIEALQRLMEVDDIEGEVINIGNPEEHTILQVARMVLELTGSASSLSFLPLPVNDPKQRRPDIEKAKRLLDWQPQINLREGLKQTIDVFRQKMGERNRP